MGLFHVKDDRQKFASMRQAPNVKSHPASALISSTQIGQPVWTNWSAATAIDYGFKASTWVYACIEKRMQAVASVPVKVQRQLEDATWEDVGKEDPLLRLLKHPNDKMSTKEMTETIVSHLDTGGNSILLKVRVSGQPAELWAVSPDKIKPIPDRTDYIKYYEYNLDGQKIKIDADDVVHFRYVDPANEFWGLSPLMAGGKTVDMEVEAVNWNKATMQNRAVPDLMISSKMPMSGKQFIEQNKYLENQLMGKSNARRPFIIGHDATVQRFALTPAELDFIQSRKMTREEICAMFAVPPPVVGIYDNATLANIETSRQIFWLDTIVPLLEKLADLWTFALASDFGPGLRVVYDLSKVQALQSLLLEKIKVGEILAKMGVPFNEINQRLELGFPELVGGDIGYISANSMQVTASAGSSFSDIDFDSPDDDDEEDTE